MEKQWGFAFRFLTILFLMAGTVWLVAGLSWVIGLFLVSTLIVYILYPLLIKLKTRFNLNHTFATTAVFLLFLLFCALIVGLIIPVVYYEVTELIENYPHYMNRFQEYLSWFSEQTIDLDIEDEFRGFLVSLSENVYFALEYLADASMSIISGAVDFFLVLLIVFFLLHDFEQVRSQMLEVVPPPKRDLSRRILAIIDINVGSFIRGSLIRCSIVGLLTGLTLLLIGMPYALLLSLIAGILNFVLYIGPFVAALPALVLSFSPLTPSPLAVALVYIGVQLVDGLFLAPVVLGKVVKLKPITVILAILAGGRLAGPIGMVFAVPVAGIVKGLIELIQESQLYTEVCSSDEDSYS